MPTTAVAAIQKILTGLPRATDRDALRKAYGHAEDFFGAMADALEAQDELERPDDDGYWARQNREALGKAADAASKMPAIWLSILGVKIEAGQ